MLTPRHPHRHPILVLMLPNLHSMTRLMSLRRVARARGAADQPRVWRTWLGGRALYRHSLPMWLLEDGAVLLGLPHPIVRSLQRAVDEQA